MSNNFLQVVEHELTDAWGELEQLAVDETKAVWNTVKHAMAGLTPAQWKDLVNLLESEAVMLVGHDYAGALQNLVMWGETKGLPWIAHVEEDVLVAALAAWKASKLYGKVM